MNKNDYISDYEKPKRFLERISALIGDGVSAYTISDMENAAKSDKSDNVFYAAFNATSLAKAVTDFVLGNSISDLFEINDDNYLYIHEIDSDADKAALEIAATNDNVFSSRALGGRVFLTRTTTMTDMNRDIEDMSIIDVLAVLEGMKMSQRGRYCLMRYNDLTMSISPLFDKRNYACYDGVDLGAPATNDAGESGFIANDIWRMYHSFYCEFRSVVMDLMTGETVSLPFYKFRNYGECMGYLPTDVATRIADASYVEFSDKMDGSFMQMRYMGKGGYLDGDACANADGVYRADDILVTTSGSLIPETNEHLRNVYAAMDADMSGDAGTVVRDYLSLCKAHPATTFIFEFVYPELDPHIVSYDESRWGIYLTSARDIATGRVWRHAELAEIADVYGLRIADFFDGMSLDGALDVCDTANATDREGFVANIDGFLVKIKINDFCMISKLVHGASHHNAIIAVTVKNMLDDLLSKIPVEYHAPLIAMADDLRATDARAREIVENVVCRTESEYGEFSPEKMKDVYAFIASVAPKSLVASAVSYYKNGHEHPETYLSKNPWHEHYTLMKEEPYKAFKESLVGYVG